MRQKYKNPHIHSLKREPLDFFRWVLGYYHAPEEKVIKPPPKCFSYPKPIKSQEQSNAKATWIGHSTYLLEVGDVHFLTDPIFAHRSSPVSWIGPSRYEPSPIAIHELPPIDAVLISHNHYDHLDEWSVLELKRLYPDIQWCVPMGVGKWFAKRGFKRVTEHEWWSESTIKVPKRSQARQVIVHFVPAQHNSGRGLFDHNCSLWGGYVVDVLMKRGKDKRFYFVGDTAYNCYDFKKIGKRFPAPDLCMCPIGTYIPYEFMRSVHSSPKEAVEIHMDVKAKLSLAMHWNTFRLSGEHRFRPPYDLYLEMERRGLNHQTFLAPLPGECIDF